MTPDTITNAVSLLAALSISTERLVEIIKGLVPWLNNQNKDATIEGWRQATLHILAALCGMATTWMAGSVIEGVVPANWSHWGGYALIGLLASGGSGFWNSILSYAKATKDIKEAQVPG